MKESVKELSVYFASLFGNIPIWGRDKYECMFQDKKAFLKACAHYYDNRKAFDSVTRAYMCGMDEYAKDTDGLRMLIDIVQNPALPKCAIEDVNAGIRKAAEPKPPPPPKEKKAPRSTFVYLMINRRNGYYKIGNSVQPKIRESTLQAEEPEIELLKSWPGKTGDEKRLHDVFAKNRIRGEWFKLSEEQVNRLIERGIEV